MKRAPLLFLDFDGVLCVRSQYGARHVACSTHPSDLWLRLWHPPAVAALAHVLQACEPRVVLTSSWLKRLNTEHLLVLLKSTDLRWLADSLHEQPRVAQSGQQTRLDAIDTWLSVHHDGEPFAILDDELSGDALLGSSHDLAGRLILCRAADGLHEGIVPFVEHALRDVQA